MKRGIGLKKSLLLAIIIIGCVGLSMEAQTQEYPTRPITLLISHRPGGGTDTCSRIIADKAGKLLNQEIIPVNKPGGGGTVAMGILANSKGDGYTLIAATSGILTSIPHMEELAYDPLKDVIPIIQFGVLRPAIFVRSDSQFKSLGELIDFAGKNPGKVSYGVPGVGCYVHLAMEYVGAEEKVKFAIIPYQGITPIVTALLGGHITVGGGSLGPFSAHVKAGKVRVLVTMDEKRLEVAPDMPTLLELGYKYGVFTEIYVIAAPKGTPPAVLKKLEGAFLKAIEAPEFLALVKKFYIYVENPLSGKRLKDYLDEYYYKLGEITKNAKLGKYSK